MRKYIYSALLLCASAITANAQTGLQKTSKGGLYTIYTHNTGDKIKLNQVISFHVTQKTDKDSVLSTSYTAGHPVKLQVQDPVAINDPIVSTLMEVFPLATLNDSLLVKIPTDSLLKGHEESRPPFFPKGSYLNLLIKITGVQSLDDAIAERNAEMAKVKASEVTAADKYIADNKLVVKTTPSGLRYFFTKTSLKPKPLKGDTVLVNYVGKLLNGKVFDTSIESVAQQAGTAQPGRTYEPYAVEVGESQVIQGWHEALALMNEGSKATFIIPSSLAYGDQGSGPIPPYSTLVFDLELVKAKRIKHAPAAPAKPAAHTGTAVKKHPVVKHTTTTKK